MKKRIQQFISSFLLITLLLGRVLVVVPALAQENPTEVPASTSAPAPTSPPESTTPPSGQKPPAPRPTGETYPTSPPLPTSAPQPTSPPRATSAPLSSDSTLLPTSAPAPTGETLPTGSTSANDLTSPTGSQTLPTYSPTGEPLPTGSDLSGENYAPGSVNDPYNTLTGPGSVNIGTENIQDWEEVVNKNLAELQNKIDSLTSTGFNIADLNTLDGAVFSGDTANQVNLLNKLNSNMTGVGGFLVQNIFDTYVGDIVLNFAQGNLPDTFSTASATVAKNAVTGPASTNTATADGSFTVKEANGNDATLTNDIVLSAITGQNSASFNTGNGTVTTGDASALGNIVNLVNTNLNVSQWLIAVINVFGTLAGNIVLPQDTQDVASGASNGSVLVGNNDTGPLSTNTASYTNTETAAFSNSNSADIVSNLDVSANTGNNNSSINTGGGFVSTGNADAVVTNSTIANSNTVQEDDTVWLVIVNDMGRWVGQIVGLDWGTNIASNSLPVTTATGGQGEQTYSALSENNGTGPMSVNDTSLTTTSNADISNVNDAAVVNNITATADSGNNQAYYNTGAGWIETGDAQVGLNLVNMVNTNVTAKKFVTVFVNVLGDFLGNIVPTGQDATPVQYTPPNTNNGGNNGISLGGPIGNPTVTPTHAPTSAIGGVLEPSPAPVSNTTADSSDSGNADYEYHYQFTNYSNPSDERQELASYYYPSNYVSAVNQVYRQKTKVTALKNSYSQGVVPISTNGYGGSRVVKRGLFISQAWAKATESTLPGILLGGASLRVNQSWLAIIPFTFILLLVRRRRKLHLGKYMNSLLEIVL